MGKKLAVEVVLHAPEEESSISLADGVAAFYLELVDSRLAQAGLDPSQQARVIDLILNKRKISVEQPPP